MNVLEAIVVDAIHVLRIRHELARATLEYRGPIKPEARDVLLHWGWDVGTTAAVWPRPSGGPPMSLPPLTAREFQVPRNEDMLLLGIRLLAANHAFQRALLGYTGEIREPEAALLRGWGSFCVSYREVWTSSGPLLPAPETESTSAEVDRDAALRALAKAHRMAAELALNLERLRGS